MRFSFLKQLISPCEPWMLDPLWALQGKQLLQGVLMGAEFETEQPQMDYFVGNRENHAIPQGKNVHVVNLTGFMLRDDGDCGQLGTRSLAAQLTKADAEKKVIGHILYVDSGGGRADSIPDLAEAIQRCSKPVVAFCDGCMCSAALYAASYCQSIIAHREDDRVGSIGTVVEFADYPKFEKLQNGQVHVRVYADSSTEKNDEMEKALEGDFQLLKDRILNPSAEKFRSEIRKNRANVSESHLTGRAYQASEVVGSLVDSIGDFASAIEKVISMSNSNIIKMEGLERIQSVESCHDLESVDGYVCLNEQQLADIDNAMAQIDEIETVRENLSQAEAEKTRLEGENAALVTKVSEKDAEIARLKASLAARAHQPLSNAVRNGGHENPVDNSNPQEFCQKLINR